jgi:hypothetical protein
MTNEPTTPEVFEALKALTRDEIERRLREVESERKALQALRRSVAARDRAERKAVTGGGAG